MHNRRSTYPKDYISTPIPEEVLSQILNSGTLAPQHKKTRPWRFKLFKGEEKIQLAQTMAHLYKTHTPKEKFIEKKHLDIQSKILKSGAIISISVTFSGLVPQWEEIAATAMGVQNMYLMCTAYHLGCYWSSPLFAEHLSDFLHLSPNEKCLGLFYIGSLE